MTDARFPERWLNDRRVLRLSDAGFRLYLMALTWSVANRTDGVLYDDDLMLMVTVDPRRAAELEKAGLWRREKDYWVIVEFTGTQSSRNDLEVLENTRRREREKKARQRARRSPGTVPRPRSPGTKGGTPLGQARTGQAVTQDLEEVRSEEEVQARDERANDEPWSAA